MADFTWFDRLIRGIYTLRLVLASGQSWQDMLAVGFGLDPTAAVLETLDEQTSHPDQATIRAGEHQGWGYTLQTVLEAVDDERQLGRLSLPGEAFVTYVHRDDGLVRVRQRRRFRLGIRHELALGTTAPRTVRTADGGGGIHGGVSQSPACRSPLRRARFCRHDHA